MDGVHVCDSVWEWWFACLFICLFVVIVIAMFNDFSVRAVCVFLFHADWDAVKATAINVELI